MNSIRVVSTRAVQIGALSVEDAGWMGPKIDAGNVRAIIERIKRGTREAPSRSVCIRVNWHGEEPEHPKREGILARLLGLCRAKAARQG